jgi:choline dehydrogenase-like flavoprotein
MRSIPLQNKKLPLLCNPYTYLPCINFKMLGVPLDRNKTSMAQAVMFYDETKRHDDVVSVALYTYRSLLIYKLLKEAPLNFANTLKLMQYLQSAFVIAGIHHPDEHTENKYIQLIDEQSSFTGDKLKANYEQTKEEVKKISLKEKEIKWALRKLSCYPLKKINPGFGSSIHYAGTIPFDNKTYLSSLNPNGQLKGINNVFVADSSGFKYLPAKGITFTLMANAYNVALEALYD